MQTRIVCWCVSAALAAGALGTASAAMAADPLVVAAGDISCAATNPNWNAGAGTAAGCAQRRTAALLTGADAVLPLGDQQYESGAAADFFASYDPTWGRFKSISHPIAGNHEYLGGNANDYFAYFGSLAGPAGKGWYSFDLGTWHIVALNSQCDRLPGGCGAGSEQEQWLRQDLATHRSSCIMALWHEPRFSSGNWFVVNATSMATIWNDFYAVGADIVLNGHRHFYERLAPMNQTGNTDNARGLRTFIVGTGGISHDSPPTAPILGKVVLNNDTFGVLQLRLHASSYDWKFVPEAGQTFTDSGTAQCHALNAPPPPPPATSTPPKTGAQPPSTPAQPPSTPAQPSAGTQTLPDDPPLVPGPTQLARQAAGLRLRTATLTRGARSLVVRGRLARRATGTVTVLVRVRIHGRVRTFSTVVRVRAGAFRARLRLPAARWRRLSLTTSYVGDATYAPDRAVRSVRRPGVR